MAVRGRLRAGGVLRLKEAREGWTSQKRGILSGADFHCDEKKSRFLSTMGTKRESESKARQGARRADGVVLQEGRGVDKAHEAADAEHSELEMTAVGRTGHEDMNGAAGRRERC